MANGDEPSAKELENKDESKLLVNSDEKEKPTLKETRPGLSSAGSRAFATERKVEITSLQSAAGKSLR